jgi:serine/threonine-protein kinase 24/25/MST4
LKPQQPAKETPSHYEPQPQEITALNSVVLPALESALARRSGVLQSHITKSNPSSSSSSSTSSPTKNHSSSLTSAAPSSPKKQPPLHSQQQLQDLRATHAHIQRLVGRVARLFREIDEWDARAPVGMFDGLQRGESDGDVGGFLEGFLEEVLVRVEAEEA